MRANVAIVGVLLFAATAVVKVEQRQAPPDLSGVPELFAVVTDGSTTGLYHTKDCAWVTNHLRLLFTEADMKKRYFRPHCLCITGKEGLPPCDAAPVK
jgi:hypothetical protein